MVYCIRSESFDNLVQDYGSSVGNMDIVIASLCSSKEELSPKQLDNMLMFSKFKQGVIVVHYGVKTNGVDTVVLIDNGSVLGVAQEIFSQESNANKLKIFDTQCGKIAIIIGNDIMYVQMWQMLVGVDCKVVVHFANQDSRQDYLTMARALSLATACPVGQVYERSQVYFNCKGELKYIDFYDMSLFADSSIVGAPYVVEKTIDCVVVNKVIK